MKMKTICKYLTGLLLLASQAITVMAQKEYLESYCILAEQNNPGLKATYHQYLAALEVIPQVSTLPDPRIGFGYFAMPVETRVGPQRLKLSANQQFPWFGTLKAKKEVGNQMAMALFEQYQEDRSKLFYQVKKTYFEYYFITRKKEILKKNIQVLQRLYQLAKTKYETGKSSAVDLFRLEMEIAEASTMLQNANKTRNALAVTFYHLLNTTDTFHIETPDTLWKDPLAQDVQALMDSMLSNNHILRKIAHRIEAVESQQTVARKAGLPVFQIGIDYTVISASDNPMTDDAENGRDALLVPVAGISIPLYRGKYNAMLAEQNLKKQAEAYLLENKKDQLASALETTLSQIQIADNNTGLLEVQINIAEQALQLLTTSYSAAGSDITEVLRMELQWLRYRLDYERALTDYNTGLAYLDYLLGK